MSIPIASSCLVISIVRGDRLYEGVVKGRIMTTEYAARICYWSGFDLLRRERSQLNFLTKFAQQSLTHFLYY